MKDFEDAVQYFIRSNNGLKTLLTRNVGDYRKTDITVLTAGDYLKLEQIKQLFKAEEDFAGKNSG